MSNCKLCLADCAFSGKDMKKGNCKGYIPMSNADRIRAMSDEEMATELLPLFEELCEDGVPSTDYMRFWLKQPAEEDT